MLGTEVNITTLAKAWIPPFVWGLCRKLHGTGIQFRGNYPDWVSAENHAEGYDAGQILDKVRQATHKVIQGEAACERDSVLFDQVPYPYPLISVLLRAASEKNGALNVLDFGGALGSSYFQCRDFLAQVSPLRWCVVEQRHYVECGRHEFENDVLSFFDSVEAAVQAAPPQVILASSVLQYLPNPDWALDSFAQTGADYIVIDRTPFSVSGKRVISVQVVPEEINGASYPLWLFNSDQFKAPLIKNYVEIASFDAVDGILGVGSLSAYFKGLVFQKKSIRKGGRNGDRLDA